MVRRRRSGERQPSLVLRFGVVSLALIGALGVLLGVQLRSTVERRNIESTESFASTTIDFIANVLWAGGGEDADIQNFAARLTERGEIVGFDAWVDGQIILSDDPKAVGTKLGATPGLRAAMRGDLTSEVVHSAPPGSSPRLGRLLRQHEDLLVVDVPVRLGAEDEPVAAVTVYFPFAPVADAITSDTRSMVGLLAAGLGVVWLGLFHIVVTASRKLRRQSIDNRRLALHDGLTGLPNRVLLRDRTDRALRGTARTGRHVGLMLLDLDRFKEINDTLGHHHGDLLLQEVGTRLRQILRDADTVARIGGDEFVVLLPDLPDATEATVAGERVRTALAEPFVIDGVTLDVETSVGVALAPDHGDTFEDLLQHADVAMYLAKESHVGVVVYAPDRDGHSPARLALLGELRRAIEDGEQLVLHYQPKADVRTREVVGVEALVRWQHPVHGLVPPMDFIPMAERTGLIRPLTTWVLDAALAQVRRWSDEGLRTRVAVNISARCLSDANFPAEVAGLLAEHGLSPDRLELELTESAIMSDPAHCLDVMKALADLGVELSIDDFGTGYSSMAYLKRLPVSELKIDRAFVTGMAEDTSDAAIVRSSVELARNLSLRVVAEGVETAEVWDRLRELGCDNAQGYYLSRPLPADELGAWLAERAAVLS